MFSSSLPCLTLGGSAQLSAPRKAAPRKAAPRKPARKPARVSASHRASFAHEDSDSLEPDCPYNELGLQPGASADAVAAAFRASILRCHPDLHGGAQWAVVKTQRVLRAAETLRGGPRGVGAASTGVWDWTRPAARHPPAPGHLKKRVPNVSFYPAAYDYWASYGEREPTAEEAARFAVEWEAAKRAAAERLQNQRAARPRPLSDDASVHSAAPFAAAVAVVAIMMAQAMFTGISDANNGMPKGSAAVGDCWARGGGLCRFM